MWLMPKKHHESAAAAHSMMNAGEQVTEPSRVVRLLLRKRYSKLGPAGDYLPTKFSSFRFGMFRKSKLGDGTSGNLNKGKEPPEGPTFRRSSSVSVSKRTVMEKLGDAYVDMVWSAASHAARPIGAKPKVPLSRALTFEKMFGEPHDTVVRVRSLNSLASLNSGVLMTNLTAAQTAQVQ